MIVILTGFISLSPLSITFTIVMWESSQLTGKSIVQSAGYQEPQKSMDRCTGHYDISAITMKIVIKPRQSINQSIIINIQIFTYRKYYVAKTYCAVCNSSLTSVIRFKNLLEDKSVKEEVDSKVVTDTKDASASMLPFTKHLLEDEEVTFLDVNEPGLCLSL